MATRSSTGSVPERFKTGAVHLLLGGIALAAVAVTVTVGARADETPQRSGGFASQLSAAEERHTAVGGEGGDVKRAAGARDFVAVARPMVQYVYLVASDLDARELIRDLQESDAVRRHGGQLPLPFDVVVTMEDADRFYRTYMIGIWNLHEGLPPTIVLDLR